MCGGRTRGRKSLPELIVVQCDTACNVLVIECCRTMAICGNVQAPHGLEIGARRPYRMLQKPTRGDAVVMQSCHLTAN
jgi:hypothetical protein